MTWMGLVIGPVDACALDKSLKCIFIGALVHTDATVGALQIPFGFLQGMLAVRLLG